MVLKFFYINNQPEQQVKLSAGEVLALYEEAERIYDRIRSTSDDVVQISHQTGIPEWKIQKIKEHVFWNDHILDDRISRFDAELAYRQK